MFGFFSKKTPPPEKCAGNPGIGTSGKTAFSNGSRTWTEHFDLVAILLDILKALGHTCQNQKTWLLHKKSGYQLMPNVVQIVPLDDGGMRTVTTVQINHPELFGGGIFEFQHSGAENLHVSFSRGFDFWAKTDFVPLLEALRATPTECTEMRLTLPAANDRPERTRRIILGPVAQFQRNAQPQVVDEEHPFCPCCLLTRSFEAFRAHLEGDGNFALRLFAARSDEGLPEADCRINGLDFPKGMDALREYVTSWPGTGYEFRKQYVIVVNDQPAAKS